VHDAWQLTGVSQPACTATYFEVWPSVALSLKVQGADYNTNFQRSKGAFLWGDPLDQDRWSKICLIMVHPKNRWIHDQSVFADSFDAPWSRQILDQWSCSRSSQRNTAKTTLRLAYNTSDTAIQVICTLTCRASKSSIHSLRQSRQIQKISKVALRTLCTASHNYTLDICRIVCSWSTQSPRQVRKTIWSH